MKLRRDEPAELQRLCPLVVRVLLRTVKPIPPHLPLFEKQIIRAYFFNLCILLQLSQLQEVRQMDTVSLLGGISLGVDTSGNFRLSPNGIAVRRDNRFYALDEGHLIDVTEMSFDSTFVRVPASVASLREKKDVIISSDKPVSALFVLGVTEGIVDAIDVSASERVEYLPSSNLLLKDRFVVRVAGLVDSKGADILPLLLLSGGIGSSGNEVVTQLLLFKALKNKSSEADELLPLLLLRGGQARGGVEALTQLLLLRSLLKDKDKDKEKEKRHSSELEDLLPFLLLANNPLQQQVDRPSAQTDPFQNLVLRTG